MWPLGGTNTGASQQGSCRWWFFRQVSWLVKWPTRVMQKYYGHLIILSVSFLLDLHNFVFLLNGFPLESRPLTIKNSASVQMKSFIWRFLAKNIKKKKKKQASKIHMYRIQFTELQCWESNLFSHRWQIKTLKIFQTLNDKPKRASHHFV